jgi:GTP-binding protein YchF
MQIGIVGLPNCGKSTLFSTLLAHKSQEETSKYRTEAERGIIILPDPRLDNLAKIYKPRKKVFATIEYIKVQGLEKEEHRGTGLPANFLANIQPVDVILIMIRKFENELYPHPLKTVDPKRDIKYIESEIILHDLAIIESRVNKLEKLIRKTQDEKDKSELAVLQKCRKCLDQECFINELTLDNQEQLLLRSYQFLSAKPFLYVVNISENEITESDVIVQEIRTFLKPDSMVIALSAKIEFEISQLAQEDANDFFKDLNIDEPATIKLINASYSVLGLQSFFTVGDVECHAWAIRKGNTALKAAGIVHSDMEKGFIKAEVVPSKDLINYGSMNVCKEKGLVRLEGKDYVVQDGDVLTIRFNV